MEEDRAMSFADRSVARSRVDGGDLETIRTEIEAGKLGFRATRDRIQAGEDAMTVDEFHAVQRGDGLVGGSNISVYAVYYPEGDRMVNVIPPVPYRADQNYTNQQ